MIPQIASNENLRQNQSKRRLYEVLQSQGMQLNQQITFLSDGSDTVRDLQLYMSPEAEHILDWFYEAAGVGPI